jgi:hypothetical protein
MICSVDRKDELADSVPKLEDLKDYEKARRASIIATTISTGWGCGWK